jgi:hypothetical protein
VVGVYVSLGSCVVKFPADPLPLTPPPPPLELPAALTSSRVHLYPAPADEVQTESGWGPSRGRVGTAIYLVRSCHC